MAREKTRGAVHNMKGGAVGSSFSVFGGLGTAGASDGVALETEPCRPIVAGVSKTAAVSAGDYVFRRFLATFGV